MYLFRTLGLILCVAPTQLFIQPEGTHYKDISFASHFLVVSTSDGKLQHLDANTWKVLAEHQHTVSHTLKRMVPNVIDYHQTCLS
jgi:hypothetical protein